MKDGKSFVAFAAAIGVPASTIRKWAENNEEFALALELAENNAQAAWEELAYGQSTGENKGSASTLTFMLKNRFSEYYKDKQEIEHKGGNIVMIDTGFSSIDAECEEIEEAPMIEASDIDLL